MTNTLAYYVTKLIRALFSATIQGPVKVPEKPRKPLIGTQQPALLANIKLSRKKITREKHSSLFIPSPWRKAYYCRLLASPTNIGLGWKGLPGTNTLAYYENPQITDKKKFCNTDTRSPPWKKFVLPSFSEFPESTKKFKKKCRFVVCLVIDNWVGEYLRGEISQYHWPLVWLVWNQLYDNWQFLFLFAK